MGQGWIVINVDLKESVAGSFMVKLGEFFFDSFGELIHSLRIPCLPKEVDDWLSEGSFVSQPAPVGQLSTELIDMIFETVLEDSSPDESIATTFDTAVNLAVTCKRFLTVGKRHILARLTALHARYVGCRLVCIGECTNKEDQAPPGMLTDAELHEIANTPPLGSDPEDAAAGTGRRRLGSFANETYRSYGDVVRSLHEPLLHLSCCISHVFMSYRRAKERMPLGLSRDLSRVGRLACADRLNLSYPDGPAVLCNLAKSEYVREDRLTAGRKNVEYTCTLAHALVSRICWSPCAQWFALECAEEYHERLARGPWAGDRFCITGLEGMPAPKDGGEWVDVTAEADELLCHLWEMNCSEDVDEDYASD